MAPARPRWHRDEFILVMELYHRRGFAPLNTASPEIVALSSLLRALPFNVHSRSENYRSPGSVHLRLANYAHHDQSYSGEGMSGGGEECKKIWLELGHQRELVASLAAKIRDGSAAASTFEDESEEEATAVEGAVLARLHVSRERNRALVLRKKKQTLRKTGRLECEACGFDFAFRYGTRGTGYIECHHKVPLSLLDSARPTRLAELALLCANCHRMVHAQRPWLSFDELVQIARRDEPHR